MTKSVYEKNKTAIKMSSEKTKTSFDGFVKVV